MADLGILFRLSDRSEIRLDDADLRQLLGYLAAAPGGPEGSPSAASAARTIERARARGDEVRHFDLSDAEEAEVLWALDREMGADTRPNVVDLRHRLTDIAPVAASAVTPGR